MPVTQTILGGTAGELARPPQGSARRTGGASAETTTLIPVAHCDSRAANRGCLLAFQSWRSTHDKFDLVTADLRQGNSRLAYAPAAQVLKALVAMFTVTAKDGPLNFTRPKKFTKNDRLITSLFEIAGKVLLLTGKPVSERVVQKALLLLHRDGLVYKTKGRYGPSHACRLFIDLKGYRLHTKLEQAMYDCTKRYPTQTKRFPTAKEGEYGFARKMTLPYTPDGAGYINGSNPSVAIDREDTSSISLQNNPTNQISPLGTKNVPLARPLFSSKGPGEENEGSLTGDSQWVEFTLTPQVQKILEFIQSHGVFVDKTGQYHPLERITAQEVASLVRAVEGGGLSLGFLKRYARMIGRQDADGWFMKTRLGFFCDHFFIIKKLFYRFEAEQRLCEVALHPGGKNIDIDFAAECFVHEAAFHPCSQAGPGEYRAIMALDPRVKDGGRDSAFVVLVASTAPDILPADRDFILAEHRDLARLWFTDKPQVYFGLLKLDIAINEALGFEADDDQKMRDVLEQQYMDAKTYRIRYAEQGAKATQDLCAFKKYQEAA